MKLAIILFGHLRTFEYCSEYFIKYIVDKYDCDIFMHTWDELDSTTKCWTFKQSKLIKINDYIINKVNNLYKPKKFLIEHQNNEHDFIISSVDGKKTLSFNGMKHMFDSMNKANKLRKQYEQETNIQYDYVLVTRPDVAIFNYLNIEETIAESKQLNLDISNVRFFAGLYGDSSTNVRCLINRVCDILFFAKPSVIDRYIAANVNLSKEHIDKTFKNVVTIYLRNEIKAGIIPIQICFAINKDWKNFKFTELPKKQKSKIYKFFHLYWLRGKK